MPLLSELIKRSGITAAVTGSDVNITSITADSRQVMPAALFVAVPGATMDSTKFIPDAIKAGAIVIMLAREVVLENIGGTTLVRVDDVRVSMGKIAAAFYPQKPAHCYAITGTDGKTSTADFVRQLAALSGRKSASIGTLGLISENAALNKKFPALNTSPETILLHQTLQQLAESGISDVAIETSSHGIDQKRAAGVTFVAGAFTNLARDHLDYHGTIELYFAAKAKLFTELLPAGATAVINHDDERYADLLDMTDDCGLHLTSFGKTKGAHFHIVEVISTAEGLHAVLDIRGTKHYVNLPFYGAFQLMNMLAAVGLIEATGMDANALVALLPKLKGVPGRLERIVEYKGAPIFIDYAHTPAALENILRTLRPHTAGKLHVVFGCGGDRDAGKRQEMGRAAVQLADVVIVTDDNPRSEDPAAIRAAILAAAPGAKEIPNRDVAIRTAVQQLQSGDVLVVAGKGHETTQTIGSQILPFNDADHIREAVAA